MKGPDRVALLWSGLRWRAGSSLAMLVIGALAVTVGAFGPIYLHAADSSVLRSTLGSASVGNVGLTLGASRNGASLRELQAAARLVPGAQSGPRWFGTPISSVDIGYSTSAAGQFYASDLVTRTGFCSQVATVEGHCPVAAGQVLLSERSAHEIGARLGSVIVADIKGKRGPVRLLVVGLYRPTVPAGGYWWGVNYFTYGYQTTIAVGSGTALVPQLDSTFTPLATFSHLARTLRPGTAAPMVQVPLVPGSVTQDNAAALATATRSYEQLMAQRYDTLVSSQLLALLNRVVSTQHTMETIAAAIDVQLLLLAVFALYFVASRTSDEREPDVRLAELRGYRPRSVFGVALAEPLAITLTALPIGLVAAWILARATAPVLFPQGVGTPLTTLAVGTAVATAAVGLATMAFGARRLMAAARSGGGAEARALQARSSAWRIVAEVAAIGLAAAAFAEMLLAGVSGGGGSTHTDPLAALAPGILAVAVGVLGARLVPALTSATLPLTRNAPRVALVLATRRIARAGEFAAQVVFVVLAVSLATFGIVGWKVAADNRAVRSHFDVGADRVLAVQVRPGVNFLTAVRRADGSGRSAMAVMVENASDGVTLAVDSTRMAQVMSWPSGLSRESVAAVAKRLVPADLNPLIVLHGDQVALSVTARVAASPLPQLSLDVMNDVYDTPGVIPLGTLHSGSQRYVGGTQGLCGTGCELTGIELSWSPPLGEASSPGQVHLTITALADRIPDSSFRVVPAGLADPHRWSAPDGGVRFARSHIGSPVGLAAQVALSTFGPVELAPANVPSELPAITTTSDAVSGPANQLNLVGLDGSTLQGRQVLTVPALPNLGATADLVDLGLAERFLSGPPLHVTTQVWLSAAARASVIQRLDAAGITVVSVDSAARQAHALATSGVSLAYTLFLVAAVAAAGLAVGATAFVLAVAARRRASELAALRAVGIPPAMLHRSIVVEQAFTLITGLVLGVLTGTVASAVALRSLPEFVAAGPGPPLQLGVPALPVTVMALALLVALAITVAVGSRVAVRVATLDKLSAGQM